MEAEAPAAEEEGAEAAAAGAAAPLLLPLLLIVGPPATVLTTAGAAAAPIGPLAVADACSLNPKTLGTYREAGSGGGGLAPG